MINAIWVKIWKFHWLYIGTAWNTKTESIDFTAYGKIYWCSRSVGRRAVPEQTDWGTGWRRFFGNITAISTGIWVKLHLHWAKANSQANSFLTSSIWTLNWILYPPIWKGCRFWANTQWKKSTGFWLFVMLFSPPHFQFKSVNISTILTSKLKPVCIWVLVSWLSLGIYIPWVESSVNKQIHLICVLSSTAQCEGTPVSIGMWWHCPQRARKASLLTDS